MICTSPAAFATQYQFDYIVIGGGTAGLAIAARLAEDPSITVGVLEAGEYVPDEPNINVPGYFGRTLGDPRYDWAYLTTPQKHVNNRMIFHPRGKVLGGSSALNFMALGRATNKEYDAIETIGNPGWNAASFMKYIHKSESALFPTPAVAQQYNAQLDPTAHGTTGPLKKRHPSWFSGVHLPFFQALDNCGVVRCVDSSNGENVGSQTIMLAIDENAKRSYSTTAYFEPNATSKNLIVLTGAQVTRLILSPNHNGTSLTRATGIEYIKNDETFTVNLSSPLGEVILSAGAFQTPQILELSGIGRKDVLEGCGIEVKVELDGVGENLQDHIYVSSCFEVDSTLDTLDIMRDPELEPAQAELYKSGSGIYATVHSAFAFLPLSNISTPTQTTTLRSKLTSDPSFSAPATAPQFALLDEWLDDPQSAQIELIQYPGFFPAPGKVAKEGAKYQCLLAALMHPASRGNSHITSSNSTKAPTIDPAYLSNSADLEILVRGCQFVRKVCGEKGLKEVTRGFVTPEKEDMSTADWEEFVKNGVEPVYHPIGTASMLPLHLNGVVSPTLLVYKTSNIRVCDASILPFHLSCHPQATIYGIAEKGADLCKEARREAVRKAAIEVKANGGTQGGRGWLSSMIWGQDAQA